IKVWVQNESGEKIKNAEVRLWKDGKKIESGKSVDGYVYFDDLCEGKYGISIFADNYKEIEFNVELGCNEQKVIEKKLVKNGDEPC
ncbi:hypothetical protein, partial [Klebsiella quasipneumoniae]|uniref:hypothetical protein n=1 Tax=Klebsiella quasipneumoniae TaxID=1463165 RepID=UPI002730AA46